MPLDQQNSFTGGEISPALHGRTDLNRYHNSLSLASNWFVHSHGGISTRAGLEYIAKTKNSAVKTRLIPFVFNAAQQYALEFGNLSMRVIRNGGLVLEPNQAVVSITAANPAVVEITGHLYSNGDEVYLIDTGVPAIDNKLHIVSNVAANTFEIPADGTGWAAGGAAGKVFELVTPYASDDLFEIVFSQSADIMTLTHPAYQQQHLVRSDHDDWAMSALTFSNNVTPPVQDAVTGAGSGAGTFSKKHSYIVTAVDSDGNESTGSNIKGRTAPSLESTRYNIIQWDEVVGAEYYRIYKALESDNGEYGFIGESIYIDSGTNKGQFYDYNFGPDMSERPPEGSNPYDSTDNYPRCSTYFQQRQFFGGTNNSPQQVIATQTARYENMDSSRPTREDDSLDFTIVSQQVNEIRHLVAMDQLIAFTSGSAWIVSGAGGDVVTPTSISVKRQGGYGCSTVRPLIIGETAVYLQALGSKIRDLAYTFEADKYTGNDLSIMAEHLFFGHTIIDWCYAEEPYGLIYAVRDDGILLCLAYLREHQVWGWSQMNTAGTFESVTSIQESGEDVVYAVVKRTLNGVEVRNTERFHTRRFTDIADSFCVDSGLTYEGVATVSITGLDHLESETVVALADGNVVDNLTVTNGSIELPDAAEKVHIGLSYECDLETLDVDFQGSGETLRSRKKSVTDLTALVRDTRGLRYVETKTGKEYEIKEREASQNYDRIPLKTGEQKLNVSQGMNESGRVYIRQSYPLPATILSLVLEVDVSG